MAWLAATPKPPEGTKRASRQAETVSRLETLRRKKIEPQLPPISDPYIVNRLVEIGLTGSTGMGAVPLSWGEIVAWQQATGLHLDPWEARIIRALSAAYIAEMRRAEAETCPPPWRAPLTRHEIDSDQARLEMLLG